MKLGVTLPLSDIGGDPATVRVFAQPAEAAGYDRLGALDHVLVVNVASRPKWARLHRLRRRGELARGIQVLEARRRHSRHVNSAFERNHHRRIASRSLQAHSDTAMRSRTSCETGSRVSPRPAPQWAQSQR
jgi:hypothetical protein